MNPTAVHEVAHYATKMSNFLRALTSSVDKEEARYFGNAVEHLY
jgi:hypothetical protein